MSVFKDAFMLQVHRVFAVDVNFWETINPGGEVSQQILIDRAIKILKGVYEVGSYMVIINNEEVANALSMVAQICIAALSRSEIEAYDNVGTSLFMACRGERLYPGTYNVHGLVGPFLAAVDSLIAVDCSLTHVEKIESQKEHIDGLFTPGASDAQLHHIQESIAKSWRSAFLNCIVSLMCLEEVWKAKIAC